MQNSVGFGDSFHYHLQGLHFFFSLILYQYDTTTWLCVFSITLGGLSHACAALTGGTLAGFLYMQCSGGYTVETRWENWRKNWFTVYPERTMRAPVMQPLTALEKRVLTEMFSPQPCSQEKRVHTRACWSKGSHRFSWKSCFFFPFSPNRPTYLVLWLLKAGTDRFLQPGLIDNPWGTKLFTKTLHTGERILPHFNFYRPQQLMFNRLLSPSLCLSVVFAAELKESKEKIKSAWSEKLSSHLWNFVEM